ncbi:DUF839 domain-containing protein [Frankia sp. CNm7]|uniref:DUF839 domain-containing protein n=1 Tax=Frankia nepalensis TaxID=1836974 RepID=A0A937UP27_9ACTN|nr:alkaline phosphatase PhoX [Frankia nepalensis]MBL7495562.1 DUF839 domain-containing protein [Frankia nepalensis]MBL7509843.1 DUF839 domain-containing protein [Frankia nepalensis]MBL7517492.1 DUF839 domain-containing protein [Frankia nepalensis]MBL7626835.1 DUF839 domain-containing protein [Frankia nepalensis]
MTVSRRGVLGAGAAGLGIVLTGAVGPVFGGTANATGFGRGHRFTGYGDLVPDPAGICDLPKGFSYTRISAVGETLTGGGNVPGAHDGMAAFRSGRDTVLVRNHEIEPEDVEEDGVPTVPHVPGLTYDPEAPGGTTTLVLTGDRLRSHVVSLAGTANNCAGGPTPWNTWLTCEETDAVFGKPHGYVFEVDPFRRLRDREPVPLKALGRFEHEAVSIDPRTGVAYLTEDADTPFGLFYRFLPKRPNGGPGSLRAGGKLQALSVRGIADLMTVTRVGTRLRATWVDVPDPDATSTPVRAQFADGKVSRIRKCEGTYYSDGYIYVVSSYAETDDEEAYLHAGQVWRYEPKSATLELVLHFQPDSPFDGPDNITISSWGRIILCEDGNDDQHLVVVGDDGKPYPLARSGSGSEFAGATFSPDGAYLYANIQEDGLTVAIKGPWR